MVKSSLYTSLALLALLLPACGGGGKQAGLGDGGAGDAGVRLPDGAGLALDTDQADAASPLPGLDAEGSTPQSDALPPGPDSKTVAPDTTTASDSRSVDTGLRPDGATPDASKDSGIVRDGAAVDTSPDSKPAPTGLVPPELVGIWQQTRSSAGDYTDGFGQSFSLTSGFSVQLRIAANGSYYFAHFASGVTSTCKTVSSFDQSVGVAVLQGTTLTLVPQERRLDVVDCVNPGSRALPNDPITFTISLQESRHFRGGLRTYLMTVVGVGHPVELTLLNRPPTNAPIAPAQPADFVLGQDTPYKEWQGLWVAANGTDSNFYDPTTKKFYFPALNGSPHQWLRFTGETYDTAVALQNTNADGVCKADVIYYERGTARLAVLEDIGGKGDHFVGHTRLSATAAHLVVRIRECDEDDGIYEYDLPPLNAFYRWIYFASGPESINLDCDTFARNEWQSLLCTNSKPGFTRRL